MAPDATFCGMKPVPFSTLHAWLILLQFLSLPLLGHLLGTAGGHPALANLLTPFWVFVVFPLLDTWVGLDRRNPVPESEGALVAQIHWRLLPLAALPAYALLLWWGAPRFAELLATSPLAALELGLAVGIVGGAIGITFAHELIHKPTALERNAGGVLLSLVAYGGFKVEHIYGHHVDVATPHDTSTARLGQSAYAFLLRSFALNPLRAWQLAGERLRTRGLPP